MTTSTPLTDPSIPLPRILCLHGGGVNATIFQSQLRSFLSHPRLSTRFRFVFADAPFFCAEGVGVRPVYETWGPFRRWFRWLESHDSIDPGACQSEIEYCLQRCMESDPGTGEWVGVLGFSQGAKLAASICYQMQISQQQQRQRGEGTGPEWRFAVVLAGRAPLVALDEHTEGWQWLQSAGGLPGEVSDWEAIRDRPDMKLRVPTVHVHGLRDEGLHLHRRLVEDYCAPGTTTVVEWDGPHRVPIKKSDVDKVVDAIVGLADEYGV